MRIDPQAVWIRMSSFANYIRGLCVGIDPYAAGIDPCRKKSLERPKICLGIDPLKEGIDP